MRAGGRRLLAADSVFVAAGSSGRLKVRAAAVHSPVTESARGADGVLVPVRLTASPTGEIALTPAEPDPDAYATAGSARGRRVLLVVAGTTPSPPDQHVARHLVEIAAAVVAAERSAEFGTIRESLHQREEERRRWARELHDDTLQQRGALQVLLTSALAGAPRGDPRCAGLVDAARLATELVAGQIGNLRQLITELRPAALDDLGLTSPLQALGRRTEQLSGIRVTLHVSLRYTDGIIGTRLVPGVELAVYRVVQEALTNIRRHSTATRASVTVVENDGTVVAEISDDGQGFDPTGPPASACPACANAPSSPRARSRCCRPARTVAARPSAWSCPPGTGDVVLTPGLRPPAPSVDCGIAARSSRPSPEAGAAVDGRVDASGVGGRVSAAVRDHLVAEVPERGRVVGGHRLLEPGHSVVGELGGDPDGLAAGVATVGVDVELGVGADGAPRGRGAGKIAGAGTITLPTPIDADTQPSAACSR